MVFIAACVNYIDKLNLYSRFAMARHPPVHFEPLSSSLEDIPFGLALPIYPFLD